MKTKWLKFLFNEYLVLDLKITIRIKFKLIFIREKKRSFLKICRIEISRNKKGSFI